MEYLQFLADGVHHTNAVLSSTAQSYENIHFGPSTIVLQKVFGVRVSRIYAYTAWKEGRKEGRCKYMQN
jgi:hypothetical protein